MENNGMIKIIEDDDCLDTELKKDFINLEIKNNNEKSSGKSEKESKIKRYFWMKLRMDFFTNPIMKKLRKEKHGDTLIFIYLKMMILSIPTDCIIKFQKIEFSFEEEIALTLDEKLKNIIQLLDFLKKMKLIERSEDEIVFLEAMNYIGSETESAERVRNYREKKEMKV